MKRTSIAFIALLISSSALACSTYKAVSNGISKKFREHLIFTGYDKNPSVVYELWGNKNKSWSLIKRQAYIAQIGANECAAIVMSGKSYVVADISPSHFQNEPVDEVLLPTSVLVNRCVKPQHQTLLLSQKHSESPIIHAVASGKTLVIYASPSSWTASQMTLFPAKNSYCMIPIASGSVSNINVTIEDETI